MTGDEEAALPIIHTVEVQAGTESGASSGRSAVPPTDPTSKARGAVSDDAAFFDAFSGSPGNATDCPPIEAQSRKASHLLSGGKGLTLTEILSAIAAARNVNQNCDVCRQGFSR